MQGIGAEAMVVDRSHKREMLVAAEAGGLLKLFRYPCITEGSNYGQASGHSSTVGCVRFNTTDTYVISVGGADGAVVQWKL